MGMAAAKVYCLYEDDSQKKFIKEYKGYKLNPTTHVFKNEDTIEFVDVPSGLLIKKYETKNMSEAIRLFTADEELKTRLAKVKEKESYSKICEDMKIMLGDYISGLFKDKK